MSFLKTWNIRKQFIALLIGIILWTSFIFLFRLGTNAYVTGDEGIHEVVTQAMRLDHHWMTMTFLQDDYFRKPPLSFWIRAVEQTILGANEWTSRLPSALGGIGTALILSMWAWVWTRRFCVVAFVGMVFPLLPSTFAHTFRTGETDGLLIFFLTLAAFLAWKSITRPWFLIAASGTVGLAFMTKDVAAGVVPVAFLGALALHRRWPYQWKHILAAIGVFVLIAAPWHIQQSLAHGKTFWGEYIGYHVVDRVTTKLHTTPQLHGPFWYVTAAKNYMFPWSWLVVPALVFSFFRIRKKGEHESFTETFLLMWSIGTFILYSLAATKLAWYIAPAYGPALMLVGRLVGTPFSQMPRWMHWLLATSGIGYLFSVFSLFRHGLSGILSLSFVPAAVGVTIIAGLGILLLITFRAKRERITMSLFLLLFMHMMFITGLQYYKRMKAPFESTFRKMAQTISKTDPNAAIAIYDIGYYTNPVVHLYLEGENRERQLLPISEKPEKLAQVLQEHAGAFFMAETVDVFPNDAQQRLKRVGVFDQLTLYTILPASPS